MKGIVSIIIPMYNREKYIAECLESVLCQSYQNFEIILIDDGSTDRTIEIASQIAENESRIKLIIQDHYGVSAARNRGLDLAQGEFVFFLDSDDVIHPELLEILVANLKRSNATIACTPLRVIYEKDWNKIDKQFPMETQANNITYRGWDEALNDMFYAYSTTPLSGIGGVMMRRESIGETRFHPQLSIGEDYFFNYEMIIKQSDVIILSPKLYFVRYHANNSMKKMGFEGFYTRFLRRKLIWESEEAFGRKKNVDYQKYNAFNCCLNFLHIDHPCSENGKKIRKIMKEHKKVIMPSLKFKFKIIFLLCLYFPYILALTFKLRDKQKTLK